MHTSAKLDAICAAAAEMAQAAARRSATRSAPGVRAEGERIATHTFAADLPGYPAGTGR
jgi:hypothetical protein